MQKKRGAPYQKCRQKERNTYNKYNSIDPKLGQFTHVEGRNYLTYVQYLH